MGRPRNGNAETSPTAAMPMPESSHSSCSWGISRNVGTASSLVSGGVRSPGAVLVRQVPSARRNPRTHLRMCRPLGGRGVLWSQVPITPASGGLAAGHKVTQAVEFAGLAARTHPSTLGDHDLGDAGWLARRGQQQRWPPSSSSSGPRSRRGTTPSGCHGASGPLSRSGAKGYTKVQSSAACETQATIARTPHHLPLPNYPQALSKKRQTEERRTTASYSN